MYMQVYSAPRATYQTHRNLFFLNSIVLTILGIYKTNLETEQRGVVVSRSGCYPDTDLKTILHIIRQFMQQGHRFRPHSVEQPVYQSK